MKKNFIEKLDIYAARKIIMDIFDKRFIPLSFKSENDSPRYIADPQNENEYCGYYDAEKKYINIFVYDKEIDFKTTACLFDNKIIVLGYNEINDNKKIQIDYRKKLFGIFGRPYEKYLNEKNKQELEM